MNDADIKVLYVEDSRSSNSPLRQALKDEGLTISFCGGGFDALDELSIDGADIVVASVSLGDLNGFQVASLIKSSENTEQLPVVLLEDKSFAVDEFWSKPSRCDLFVTVEDLKDPAAVAVAVKALSVAARNEGWERKRGANVLVPTQGFSSNRLMESYRSLLDDLLLERTVNRLARTLIAMVEPRTQFLDAFFELVSRLFEPDLIGLVVADLNNPWAALSFSKQLSGPAYQDVLEKITNHLNINAGISVELRGQPPQVIVSDADDEEADDTDENQEDNQDTQTDAQSDSETDLNTPSDQANTLSFAADNDADNAKAEAERAKKIAKKSSGKRAADKRAAAAAAIQNGPALEKFTSFEVMTVGSEKQGLGALVFGTSDDAGFSSSARAFMTLLTQELKPVVQLLLAKQEIEVLHSREAYRAAIDSLTGLYNLEFLVGFLQQQLLFSYRQRLPVGMVIVDLDNFAAINQDFGYEFGDSVLTTVANRLLNVTRSSDLLARYGGDQFAVVLPNTDEAGAKVLAEKVRSEIEVIDFSQNNGRRAPKITVSVGCASFNMEDLNPETILRDAKIALRSAKDAGRNRIAI